jgi:hypothetical protein
MSFHQFKSQDKSIKPFKPCKLSEILSLKHLINGDLLDLDHSNITEIDKVPGCYLKATKLNFSSNFLNDLTGISQFKRLTHLFISGNLLENVKEFEKVQNKEQVVVLTAENNPFSTHPDLVSHVLLIFPRLVEFNGKKITDHARQDLLDGIALSRQLLFFMSKNEVLLQGLEKDIQSIKKDLQNSEKRSPAQSVENDNFRMKKTVNIPPLPHYSYSSKIRPYMILNFVEIVGKAAHYYLSDQVDQETQEKIFKWLFCEVLLNLHSWGNHKLQSFLQTRTNHPDPDTCFDMQLKFFQSMRFKILETSKFSDIFPNEALNEKARSGLLSSYFSESNDWSFFPVFALNSDYLKAIFMVVQAQVKQLQELSREKEELLSFDPNVSNVSGIVGKFYAGNRGTSYDFSQDLRASSRTTVKRYGSPVNFSASPNEMNDLTEEKRREIKTFDESLEKTRLIELKNEVESEKIRLEQKMKEFDEKERIEKIRIQENFKENQKKMESFKKKVDGLVGKGLGLLEKYFNRILMHGFLRIRGEKQSFDSQKTLKNEKNRKVEHFYRLKNERKCFGALRYFQVLAKMKRIKAEEFYKGKLQLDHFFKWKSFLVENKKIKQLEKDEKTAAKLKKQREKLDFKQELEDLIKKITSNGKNLNKFLKCLKKKKIEFNVDCICGGFKCQACLKEKTKMIENELKSIKSEILKAKKKFKSLSK